MAIYKDLFNDKSANLAAQDYIPAATGSWISRAVVGADVGMTNFRTFIETGAMKFHGPEGEITLDMSKDDALVRTIKDAVQDATREVRRSDEYRALMEADPPTIEQRLAYEQVLSKAVFDEIEEVDGLQKYRLDKGAVEANDMSDHFAYSRNEIVSDNNLNSLSKDIDGKADMNVSYTTDFECEKMSAVKGMIMQIVEDSLLPPDDGTLSSAGSYFNAQGGMYMIGGFVTPDLGELVSKDDDVDVSRGWHAFVTSSKSGAVFEATAVQEVEVIGQNFYGADRMLIPLNFDGHLPEQAPYNYNFAMLAAGGRVGYVPMDPQTPGQIHPDANFGDIKAYQVGSNDQLFAERMMAIQSGNLEKLDDLQKTIPQMSMDLMRNDLKYAAADFFNRKVSETVKNGFNNFDPEGAGPLTFIDNAMRKNIHDFEGIPESLKSAYTDYAAKGLDVPHELLLEIADDLNAGDFLYGNVKVQDYVRNLNGLREQGSADIEQQLVKSGMAADEAKLFAEDFKHKLYDGEEFTQLNEAAKISSQLATIVSAASDAKTDISLDIKNATISLSGDQNSVAASVSDHQVKQPETTVVAAPQTVGL